MLQNLFTTSPLIWGGLIAGLVALPILIHLINMMRHRRVQWAAMDFLLKSYKKQRNWIWLKQLLLLLARIAVLVLALFTLANVGCDSKFAQKLLGGKTTHHYVLLDDSFSMSERVSGAQIFDRAKKTVQTIGARVGNEQNQRFTLLRYSRAELSPEISTTVNDDDPNDESNEQFADVADLNGTSVDSAFQELLEEKRNQLEVSQLSCGPGSALAIVKQLINSRPDEDSEIHIVSDFRSKDWESNAELKSSLEKLGRLGKVNLVRCAKNDRSNLAITNLQPIKNVRAAGVPLFCDVTVKNYGEDTASKIQLDVKTFLYDNDDIDLSAPSNLTPQEDEIPTVFFDEIKPGESATQRFAIFFAKPGQHVIEASLPEDTIPLDNRRRAVIQFVDSARVLLIDDADQINAFYLSSAFEPSEKQNTGVSSQIETVKFLRTASVADLQSFSAIYLLDVAQLEEASLRKLESYVKNGGGLGIFMGPKVDASYYNDAMFAKGKGLFPVPLERSFTLPEKTNPRQPDIVSEDHPIFSAFAGLENSLLDLVNIESFIRPTAEWKQRTDDTVQVAAWVRQKSEDPLVLEKRYGEGRVVTFLTTAAPIWHNWNKNPTFVVTLLELQDHLASSTNRIQRRTVGNAIRTSLNSENFRSEIPAVLTAEDGTTREARDLTATREGDELTVSLGTNANANSVIERCGIYELWPIDNEGNVKIQRYAVNLDETESDIATTTLQSLIKQFADSDVKAVNYDEISPDPHHSSATQLSKVLLGILLLILVIEQVLAYLLSYHPGKAQQA